MLLQGVALDDDYLPVQGPEEETQGVGVCEVSGMGAEPVRFHDDRLGTRKARWQQPSQFRRVLDLGQGDIAEYLHGDSMFWRGLMAKSGFHARNPTGHPCMMG